MEPMFGVKTNIIIRINTKNKFHRENNKKVSSQNLYIFSGKNDLDPYGKYSRIIMFQITSYQHVLAYLQRLSNLILHHQSWSFYHLRPCISLEKSCYEVSLCIQRKACRINKISTKISNKTIQNTEKEF